MQHFKRICVWSGLFVFAHAETTSVVVSVYAGAGGAGGYLDGPAHSAQFNNPNGIVLDTTGILIVADTGNNMIRRVMPDGTVSTVAGSLSSGLKDGVGTAARFNLPTDVSLDASGNIYVADGGNNLVRKITPNGTVSTVAGSGKAGFADGVGSKAMFNFINDLAVDPNGNVIVTDALNNRIRKVTPDGTVTTIAGNGSIGGTDGPGATATFNGPWDIAFDASGNMIVPEFYGLRVRKISPDGLVSTIAGTGVEGFVDGPGAFAQFNSPTNVILDAVGNIYIGEAMRDKMRMILPNGTVTTLTPNGFAVIGSGSGSSAVVGGSGSAVVINRPAGIALDDKGNMLVAEYGGNRIVKVSIVSTSDPTPPGITATPTQSPSGVDSGSGSASQSMLNIDAIVGIVIAGLVFVLGIAGIVYYIRNKRRPDHPINTDTTIDPDLHDSKSQDKRSTMHSIVESSTLSRNESTISTQIESTTPSASQILDDWQYGVREVGPILEGRIINKDLEWGVREPTADELVIIRAMYPPEPEVEEPVFDIPPIPREKLM